MKWPRRHSFHGALGRRSFSEGAPSRIGLRLLAFNLLLVFLPVAGILYLDVYETALLEAQERNMVQQGRLVAAALGDRDELTAEQAGALLARMGRRADARIRIYDVSGAIVADSARVPEPPPVQSTEESASASVPSEASIRERLLYRVGAELAKLRYFTSRVMRALLVRSRTTPAAPDVKRTSPTPEVRAALAGQYGAATRPTPGQRSLTLNSALPIKAGDRVIGAVLVSQSTFRILQALYGIRLRVFQIVVASVLAAAVLSLLVSATIVRPLVSLRRAAVARTERRGAVDFPGTDRGDEIGDLARSLDALTRRLDDHIRLLESFAGDVSHEFKNPLASIRVTAEMLGATEDAAERRRLIGMLTRDVDRLERLVSGVRELAHIDAQLAHEALEAVDVSALLREMVDGLRATAGDGIEFDCRVPSEPLTVNASRDRLGQVFENILRNAVSFTPPGSVVEISAGNTAGSVLVTIGDRGPGIPRAHVDRVFERFFSYRPDDPTNRREHAGLGLAIARAIVEGYDGSIRASNRDGGGALFEVRLRTA
jgi:two-component system, OmpR family, sensor histidine kinase ChvG